MFNITSHHDIPAEFRSAGLYPYLDNALREYWLHAIDVAHQLLAKHKASRGSETYYQDRFGTDFIAALQNNWIPETAGVVGIFKLDHTLTVEQKNGDAGWREYKAARDELKTQPRGSQILVHKRSIGYTAWEARIHAGGQYVSDCATMKKYEQQPPASAAVNCLLSYEAYLARKQAETEMLMLANYARIRELNLQPGTMLKEIELYHNGKTRKFSFRVESISPAGKLVLAAGKLRGSGNSFSTTVEACSVDPQSIAVPSVPVKAPVDTATAELF
jgi:hypothetical protein